MRLRKIAIRKIDAHVTASFLRLGFFSDRSGVAALIFAFALLPAILVVGGALDFANVFRARSQALGALDSAALAGASAAVKVLLSGGSAAAAKTAGDNAAAVFLASNFTSQGGASLASYDLGGSVTATEATYSPTATINVETSLLKLAGLSAIPISLKSTATASAGKYVDVYLMIDISGSMLIGATDADMKVLKANLPHNCVFACHDGTTDLWNGSFYGDNYQWAIKNKVTLRYQVVLSGVTALVDYLNSVDPSHIRIRLAMYAFDKQLTKVSSLSFNFSNITNKFPDPAIDNNDGAGATLFDENISTMISYVGKGGDGSTASSPRKLFILATDGVEDPGRQWVDQTWLRPQVKGFDMTFCQTLKSNNVTVGVLNTPYLPLTWDWGYLATLGQSSSNPGPTRVDDIAPAFSACAGSLFISASDTATITSGFAKIFQSFTATRLSK